MRGRLTRKGLLIGLIILVMIPLAAAFDGSPSVTLVVDNTTPMGLVNLVAVGIDIGTTNVGMQSLVLFEDGSQSDSFNCNPSSATCTHDFQVLFRVQLPTAILSADLIKQDNQEIPHPYK